jgi:hypothetical protein
MSRICGECCCADCGCMYNRDDARVDALCSFFSPCSCLRKGRRFMTSLLAFFLLLLKHPIRARRGKKRLYTSPDLRFYAACQEDVITTALQFVHGKGDAASDRHQEMCACVHKDVEQRLTIIATLAPSISTGKLRCRQSAAIRATLSHRA